MLEAKKLQLETEGTTVRDSEFNWGAGPFSTRRLATATRKVMTVEAPAGVNEAYR
jgi:crotonobetainyl-CoA:carnitine CoA-transferase CaiB-like acyl-CoA transferase